MTVALNLPAIPPSGLLTTSSRLTLPPGRNGRQGRVSRISAAFSRGCSWRDGLEKLLLLDEVDIVADLLDLEIKSRPYLLIPMAPLIPFVG